MGEVFAVRKMFHFAALTAFLPVILVSPKFLVFAANVFIPLFVIVEFSKKYVKGETGFLAQLHAYEYE